VLVLLLHAAARARTKNKEKEEVDRIGGGSSDVGRGTISFSHMPPCGEPEAQRSTPENSRIRGKFEDSPVLNFQRPTTP
jgi:hypothetical protein